MQWSQPQIFVMLSYHILITVILTFKDGFIWVHIFSVNKHLTETKLKNVWIPQFNQIRLCPTYHIFIQPLLS
jgi:hypothetical protein